MTDVRIVVTGANGFIGRNLFLRLTEAGYQVNSLDRDGDAENWSRSLEDVDAVFHLAGVNRPHEASEFESGNADYTRRVVEAVALLPKQPLIVFASSTKAVDKTAYGLSKQESEKFLDGHAGVVANYRLPNVFGKWAQPNYNSVVATFCWNVARGLPITVHDRAAPLSLIYIDDLIDQWLALLAAPPITSMFVEHYHMYRTTVGEVADIIQGFADFRSEARVANVGTGLTRALYATYTAALPVEKFSYPLVAYSDSRGMFAELLKTPAAGQFSFFTAHPGVTRGGHYHHTKTEKFIVVKGTARFRFRHIITGETYEVLTEGSEPVVVETIPGWAHDVTNIGTDELISLLWASEAFDRSRPDTIAEALV